MEGDLERHHLEVASSRCLVALDRENYEWINLTSI